MNIIDIIIVACFAISIAIGLKDGAIRQLGTLGGIIVSIFLAKNFGSTVSSLLGIGGDYATLWGYAIVLIGGIILFSLAAKILFKIISAAGLGFIDRFAGAILSIIKCAILLCIAFSLFNFANSFFGLVDKRKIDESRFYGPVVSTSKYIMPAIDWVEEQIPTTPQEDKES